MGRLPGNQAQNRLGSPLTFPKWPACAPSSGLGFLCLPEQHLGPYPLGQEVVTYWCMLVTNSGLHFGREKDLCLNKGKKTQKAPIFSNLAVITTLWLFCCADAVLENGPVQLRDLHHEMHIFR